MSAAINSGEAEFPFGKATVFNALLEAIPKVDGMSVHSSDQMSGRIVAKAGVSLLSWGENIPISLTEPSANRTVVRISSAPKTGIGTGGFLDDSGLFAAGDVTFGKHHRNVEKILAALSDELKRMAPTEPALKKCPFCAETIQAEAIKCRFCGSDLAVTKKAPPEAEVISTPAQVENAPTRIGGEVHFRCFTCEQPLSADVEAVGQEFRCPECGEHLTVPEV